MAPARDATEPTRSEEDEWTARTPVTEWWQAVLLGLIEGLTEFLPVSSTAHLLIAGQLLDFRHSQGGAFEIAIQFGAVVAVLGYYGRNLLKQARIVGHDPLTRQLWLGIVVATMPVLVVGLALRNVVKTVLFASPLVIACALILGGLAFVWIERRPAAGPLTGDLRKVSLRQALGIGLIQVLALVPGVSRSGAVIVGGMAVGLNRATATAFSFYLAIPTLGAATALELVGAMTSLAPGEVALFLIGTVSSCLVSWASIGWLLSYVSRNSFIPFAIYRIVLGLVVLGLLGVGVIR